jgi:chromosome segregation ATPase
MSDDTTITTLETLVSKNIESESEEKYNLQHLNRQLESQERELEQAEKREKEAADKSARADKLYEDLLGYFNRSGQPQELRDEIDRLQGQQNQARAESQEVSQRAQGVRDRIQKAKGFIEEQKQRSKTLAEDQEKLHRHINNLKQENAS